LGFWHHRKNFAIRAKKRSNARKNKTKQKGEKWWMR
jgi:hypothetical protein